MDRAKIIETLKIMKNTFKGYALLEYKGTENEIKALDAAIEIIEREERIQENIVEITNLFILMNDGKKFKSYEQIEEENENTVPAWDVIKDAIIEIATEYEDSEKDKSDYYGDISDFAERELLKEFGKKKKYAVKVIEKLTKTYIVEADDWDDAVEKTEMAHENGDIILSYDDFDDVDFAESNTFGKNEVLSNNAKLFEELEV